MRSICSNSTTTLLDTLLGFEKLESVSIASPFISSNTFLSKILSHPCRFRLIFRLCTQSPLAELQKLIDCKHAEIRYFIGDDFHSKIYIVNESHLFIGSSNFTFGGLQVNKEINIGLDISDMNFVDICHLFEEYWAEAMPFGETELKAYTLSRNNITSNSECIDFEQSYSIILSRLKQPRRQYTLTPEGRAAQINGVRASLSKAVVCLNNGNGYPSLIDASEAEYSYKRGYSYISAVCRGEKKDYKGKLWLFKEDYLLLDQHEIDRRLFLLNQAREHEKITEKYLYDHKVFDTQTQVIEYFALHGGRPITRQTLSAKICTSRKLGLPFCRLRTLCGDKYIFFAEFYQIILNGEIAEEIAIEKTLEELEDRFLPLFDLPMGDCLAIDILLSTKHIYKSAGQYYKNRSNIIGNNEQQEIITKDDLLLDIEMFIQ